MKQKFYEIWVNQGSQTWKIFTEVTDDLRATLTGTGWKRAVQYEEDEINSLQQKTGLKGSK